MYVFKRLACFAAVLAFLTPSFTAAESMTQDFVRTQAAKASFLADVANTNRIAADMFRVAGYAVMRLTHQHWEFNVDTVIDNAGQTYAYKINSNAEDNEYDVRRFERAFIRNSAVPQELKIRAQEMVNLVDKLRQQSLELAKIYDTGDARLAGNLFHEKIMPTYEAIRREEASISALLSEEIKMDALKFKP